MSDPQPSKTLPFVPPDSLDPPDLMAIKLPTTNNTEIPKYSFEEMLMNKSNSLNKRYNFISGKSPMYQMEEGDTIQLTNEDKLQIYQPWQHSVIMKLLNKCLTHYYLKTKLADLWKPTEAMMLIDLGYNFYIAKFNKPESTVKALHDRPWFITSNFLSEGSRSRTLCQKR